MRYHHSLLLLVFAFLLITNSYCQADFNLSVKPGISFTSFDFEIPNYADFHKISQTSPRFGLEAELRLPFAGNDFAIFTEPNYERFSGTMNAADDRYKYSAEIAYTSISLPIGLRYHLYINDKSTVHFNILALVYDIILEKEAKIYKTSILFGTTDMDAEFDLKKRFQGGIGIGYNYQRFSVEARYFFAEHLIPPQKISSNLSTMSFIGGYRIF